MSTGSAAAKDTIAPLYGKDHPKRIRGSYIVRFHQGVDAARSTEALVRKFGLKPQQVLRSLGGFWGEIPDARIEELRRDPAVKYIEADVAIELQQPGVVTQTSAPMWLDRMDQRTLPLNGSYSYSVTGAGVNIWIVDNGVDMYDAELSGRVSTTHQFSFNGQNPHQTCSTTQDGGTHGTAMARFAAGTTSGPAKGATVFSARVNVVGACKTLSSAAASSAMEYIADYSPRPAVINYSAAKDCSWIFCGNTVDDAVNYAMGKGVTVVVSAGNGNDDQVPQNACGFSPAHVGGALTVAASIQNTDTLANYSNYGSCVDLIAPVAQGMGTSGAAALTSGVAALHLQLYPSAGAATVNAAVLDRVTNGAIFALPSGTPNKLLYAPQLALNSSIPGPVLIGPSSYCSWSAFHTGGQPPYTYQWKRDGSIVTFAQAYSVGPAGNSGFSLELLVTDAIGRTHTSFKSIAINPSDYSFSCVQ
ncbi:S8 family serine peptidase [Gemmatimonas sp. UBA7669]|uniref:S8 family serine peptidase n=1 Tax=Gemmatimonas sp. UBA7669 TaxID=1946568 RepID=UPI0025B9D0C6|nr:S8 family serine peptidase [Gemmatimonas sp. UBA7669]